MRLFRPRDEGTARAGARPRRWPRRLALTAAVIFVIYTIAGFFLTPYIVRRVLTGSVAASLHRAITVGPIAFNPYKLRLQLKDLHIADRDPQHPFVDLPRLVVRLSWSTLRRLAPVIGELDADGLAVHIARTGEQTFNFSDLIARPPPSTPPPPSKPFYFAVSNIQLNNGAVYFDDEVMAQEHRIEHVRLALPFIANLPADTDIFVRPYLQMVIDGSPFLLAGKSKPFGRNLETELDLDLHHLDLTRYFAYAPIKVPVKLPKGSFSTVLQIHFENADGRSHIRIAGSAALDTVELHDVADAPLLSLKHARMDFTQVRPLEGVFHLQRIALDGLDTNLVRKPGGATNLTPLFEASSTGPAAPAGAPGPSPNPGPSSLPSPVAAARGNSASPTATATPTVTPTAAPSPSPSPLAPTPIAQATPPQFAGGLQYAMPAAATPTPVPEAKATLDAAVESFELSNSSVNLTDETLPTPAAITVNNLSVKLQQLRTVGDNLAPYAINANLASGGTIAATGNLGLARRQVTTNLTLTQIDLAALKAFAAPYLNATLASGKLSASATTQTDLRPDKTNVHVEPATLTLENFDLRAPDGREQPVAFGKFTVAVKQADLASRQVFIDQVHADTLKLYVRRARNRRLNLLDLAKTSAASPPPPVAKTARSARRRTRRAPAAPPAAPAAPNAPAPGWQYQIAALTLDKAELHALDETGAAPVKLDVAPLELALKGVSNDLAKPIGIAMQATVNRKGTIKIDGSAAPEPLDAKLRIVTRRLDLTALNAYLGNQVNVKIGALMLTMNGAAQASQRRRGPLRATYRGDVILGGARFLDRVTGDDFVRFGSLKLSRIVAAYGGAKPHVRIGHIALANFYSRVILESNGRLNFKDITSSPEEARRSLTRPEETGPPPPAPPPTEAAPAPAAQTPPAPPKPLPFDMDIGGITLAGGNINYTDHFIQPHYSADLTQVAGEIGAFGTASTAPADVRLEGLVNDSGPLTINGSVNPLAPMAFVDIAAKAEGIELPGLSPYSAKYTGYPIIKGTLKLDVHYLLKDQQLTANNHIYIDQLTFGDKVEGKSVLNLPIRLAVALLKNSQGVIDLTIPVSGSLNNPQFSIGGAILLVLKNLITKVVEAPFSLLGSALGGLAHAAGGNGGADLQYIMFKPGFADLTPDSQQRLALIAKALSERPALQLEIAGVVNPQFDTDGVREAKLDQQVLEQKLKDVGDESAGDVTVGKDEYNKYLKRAYKAAKFAKPRDVVGMTKSLPPDQMRKLMLAHEDVTPDDLTKLANRRAEAARKGLTQKGIALSRLFLVAPELNGRNKQDSATAVLGVNLKLQ